MPPRKKKSDEKKEPSVKKATTAKKEPEVKKAPPNALAKARLAIKKALKKDDPSVDIDPNIVIASRPHLPSNSIALDYLIGGMLNNHGIAPCPGWPKGAISQIYGHESSGKTTVALEAAAKVCAEGGSVCFIDWENALDLSYANSLGVPTEDASLFYLVQPTTLEDGMKVLWAVTAAGVDLVILDSIGAGVPEDVFKQSLDEQGKIGRVGLVAAKWSSFLPKVAILAAKSGTHVMGLSQIRSNIGMTGYGPKTTQQGGKAWRFYSSIRILFTRIKSESGMIYDGIENKLVEKVIAGKIKAKVEKSKVSSSQQHEGTFWVVFGEGIDDFRTILEICTTHGIIVKGGAWYAYDRPNGEQIRGQGLVKFRKNIEEAEGAEEELRAQALERLRNPIASHIVDSVDEEDADSLAALMEMPEI